MLIIAALGLLAVWTARPAHPRLAAGRFLDGDAHRPLSHLVCAEHAGPRRHLCRRVRVVGPGLFACPMRDRKPWAAALWFMAAALSKETAIAIPLTLAVARAVEGFRSEPPARQRLWREAAWLASCVVPLAAWYGWHFAKTGHHLRQSGIPPLQRAGHARARSRRWPRSCIAFCT